MKIPKSVLSAILIGLTVQTTSCMEENEFPEPAIKQSTSSTGENPPPMDNCPACGMG